MEYALLIVFTELFSTTISYGMLDYNINHIYKKIGDKGYKVINNMTTDTIELLNEDEVIDKVSKVKLYFPIYNIFYSKKIRDKNTEKQISRLIEDGLIVKMNETEDKEYKHIMSSDEKMLYILNQEAYKTGNINIDQPKERCMVKSVEKLQYKYTEDEVDLLSNSFERKYVLGTVNNEKVAILGTYECDINAKLPRISSFFDGTDFKELPRDVRYGNDMFTVYTYRLPSNNKRFNEAQRNIYIARNMVNIMLEEKAVALNQPKKLVK